jgi:hypothetical protein
LIGRTLDESTLVRLEIRPTNDVQGSPAVGMSHQAFCVADRFNLKFLLKSHKLRRLNLEIIKDFKEIKIRL